MRHFLHPNDTVYLHKMTHLPGPEDWAVFSLVYDHYRIAEAIALDHRGIALQDFVDLMENYDNRLQDNSSNRVVTNEFASNPEVLDLMSWCSEHATSGWAMKITHRAKSAPYSGLYTIEFVFATAFEAVEFKLRWV